MAIRYHNKLYQGSALLSALFIMTLVAIATTAMTTRLQLDIYRTRLTLNSDKLYLASQSVTFWAMDLLSRRKFKTPLPSEIDFPPTMKALYPNVVTTGKLIDLQARFNLNNLQDKQYKSSFSHLLKTCLPDLNQKTRDFIVEATRSWISNYQPGGGHDHLLSAYLNNSPPYLPSHQLMKTVSEFRLIQGVTAENFQAVAPFIIALPKITPININTASKPVLKSLGGGLNDNQANELDRLRGDKGLDDLNTIKSNLDKLNIPTSQVTTESQYYLSKAIVSSDNLSLTNFTLLHRRKDKKGNITVTIEAEGLNTM